MPSLVSRHSLNSPLPSSAPQGIGVGTCFALPSSDFPLPLLMRIFLASWLELTYLHQPRRFYRAGLARIRVTKMKENFLYSKYKIIVLNILLSYTTTPGDSHLFPPQLGNHWLRRLFPAATSYSSSICISMLSKPMLFLFCINISGCFLIPEYSPFASWWH